MGIEITIRGGEELTKRLLEIDAKLAEPPTQLFTDLGSQWEFQFRKNILDEVDVDGNPFAELSPLTQKLRQKDGFGAAHPILRRKSDLLNSIHVLESGGEVLRVGTSLHRGEKLLQYGGFTPPDSRYPNRPVPPRPFIGLSAEMIAEALELVELHYFGDEGAPADA